MPAVQLLTHRDPAVAAQILDVLRPAAAQEAGWLGLPLPGESQADAAQPGEAERTEADDIAEIVASTRVHLGARLSVAQAQQAGVADHRRLAAVLSLAPDQAPGLLCIALLVVAPWAQRRGLGRALVQAALQRGSGWGFTVTAACANSAALALYQGLGFQSWRQGLLGAAQVPVVQLLRAPDAPTQASPVADAAGPMNRLNDWHRP
jgi:ribosomal protein S18 acetylase RimI-like enzyme